MRAWNSPLHFYNLVSVWSADRGPPATPTSPPTTCRTPPARRYLANTTLETYKQNVSCFQLPQLQFPGELAAVTAFPPGTKPNPVVAMDKSLFASHVVLFPFFIDPSPQGCKAACAPTSAAAASSRHP